jgi:hypothetical protein
LPSTLNLEFERNWADVEKEQTPDKFPRHATRCEIAENQKGALQGGNGIFRKDRKKGGFFGNIFALLRIKK